MPAAPNDKVVVVTGAARGLGREWVREYLLEPNTFVVAIVRRASATSRLDELKGDKLVIIEGDLANVSAFDEVAKKIGSVTGGKVDVLINNAGTMFGAGGIIDAQITASTFEEWDEEFKVNTFAPIFFTKALIPLLAKSNEKKVVFISTMLAQQAFHEKTDGSMAYVSYSAAKAALNMANLKFHHEFRKDGYVFVTINPGWVRTEIDPSGNSLINAPLTPEQSISRCKSFVDRMTPKDSGRDYSLEGLEDTTLIQ